MHKLRAGICSLIILSAFTFISCKKSKTADKSDSISASDINISDTLNSEWTLQQVANFILDNMEKPVSSFLDFQDDYIMSESELAGINSILGQEILLSGAFIKDSKNNNLLFILKLKDINKTILQNLQLINTIPDGAEYFTSGPFVMFADSNDAPILFSAKKLITPAPRSISGKIEGLNYSICEFADFIIENLPFYVNAFIYDEENMELQDRKYNEVEIKACKNEKEAQIQAELVIQENSNYDSFYYGKFTVAYDSSSNTPELFEEIAKLLN